MFFTGLSLSLSFSLSLSRFSLFSLFSLLSLSLSLSLFALFSLLSFLLSHTLSFPLTHSIFLFTFFYSLSLSLSSFFAPSLPLSSPSIPPSVSHTPSMPKPNSYQLTKRSLPQFWRFPQSFGKLFCNTSRTMRAPYQLLRGPQKERDFLFLQNGLGSEEKRHFKSLIKIALAYRRNRQIQEYCLAGGSWSTVGPLASALQEGPKPYSCLPNQQRGSPSWRQSKRAPRRQANRTA